MARLLKGIENLILHPDAPRGRWERDDLAKQIENVLAKRNVFETLVNQVGRELGRATGHTVQNVDDILPELEDVISTLESIQHDLHSEGQKPIPLTKLGRHIRQRLEDDGHDIDSSREILRRISHTIDPTYSDKSDFKDLPTKVDFHIRNILSENRYEARSHIEILKRISRTIDPTNFETTDFVDLPTKLEEYMHQTFDESHAKNKSSSEILERISRSIDPTNSDPSSFEDLPHRVDLLVQGSASRQNDVGGNKSPDSERAEGKDAIEMERRLKWATNLINELQKSAEVQLQREEQTDIELKNAQKELTQALEEAGQLRITVKAKDLEIQQMAITDLDLRRRQKTLEGKLTEAERSCKTISEARQAENQRSQTTEKNMREAHAKELKDQKTVITLQHDAEMIAQSKEHESEKQRIETQLRGLHDDALKKQRQAEAARAKSAADELRQREASLSEARQKIKVQDAQLREHQQSLSEVRKQIKVQDSQLHEYQQSLSEARKQIKVQDAQLHEHQQSLSEARKQIKVQDAQLHEYQQSLSEARKQIKVQDAQRIALEKHYDETLAKQTRLHSKALKEAETEKKEQLEKLQQEHSRQTLQKGKKWEADKTELEGALRLEKVRSQEKVEEEAQKHKTLIEKLETELREENARTAEKVEEEAQKHKATIVKLETGRKKLLGMLLKQEDYPGLSDQEIVRGVSSKTGKVAIVGFGSMVSKVTTFSEWEWREDRKIWSTDTLTALVGTKQRRLKKLILGDAIWTTLYQLIFCSPFRVLGKEGEHLEEVWSDSFPSDDNETSDVYQWPIPDELSEKYRYDTCEAALDSLTKPSSPYNALRHSFVKHQPHFHRRFLETVDAFVDLTNKRKQDMIEFLTAAVHMWIVLCTHRCRIRMILLGSTESDPEKKSKLAQEREDLEFTVTPRLQRHGNAKGEQLEEVSVVSGCNGKVATIHES
ncbi:hypothetical protein DL95DRAFT_477060 [Leptodontidium sp. 2 PMI_412]|nr:hypothetical protein DL95DRAFT_477060 [Leptodontidium sp. 2 PMI_412]